MMFIHGIEGTSIAKRKGASQGSELRHKQAATAVHPAAGCFHVVGAASVADTYSATHPRQY
jgi:hypothetical protein